MRLLKEVFRKIAVDIKDRVLRELFRNTLIAILESALLHLKNDDNFKKGKDGDNV